VGERPARSATLSLGTVAVHHLHDVEFH